MPRDGSGVYTLPTGNPVVDGTAIEADWANDTMSDLGNEISGSLPRNGVAPMSGNLAMGSNKITGLANGTAATDAVSLGQADAKYAIEAAANTFTAVQEISVNTTTPALKVTQAGTGNVLELLDVAGDTTPFTIDTTGCAISGHTAVISTIGKFGTYNNPNIEIVAANGSAFAIHQYANTGIGPTIIGMKSRGATIGAAGAMIDGDSLLSLLGCSSGTTVLNLRACGIWFESDGVSTNTSSPGRLVFNTTPSGTVVPVERFRIAATGAFGLSGANYGTAGQVLTSAGSASPPTWSNTAVDTALTNRVTAVEQGGTLTSATVQASTSGTTIDFGSIPAWAKRITIMFAGVSTNGTSNLLIRLGDSGGLETTGYLSATSTPSGGGISTSNYTNGFNINSAGVTNSAASVYHGALTLTLLDAATFTWTASGFIGKSNAAESSMIAGSKALSAALDRLSVTTANGTDAFDAGSINILYE